MFELILLSSYINFVGFILMYFTSKIFGYETFERVAVPLMYAGIIPSIIVYVYFGVPIIVYSWQHVIVPILRMCQQFWL